MGGLDEPTRTKTDITRAGGGGFGVLLLCALLAQAAWAASTPVQLRFDTPQAAADALKNDLKTDNESALLALFGQEYADQLMPKDKVAGREGRQRVYQAMEQGVIIQQETADRAILVLGNNQWPFPIPLVRSGADWRFYTAGGIEELLDRRIGMDELNAIRVCQAYITAQRDYTRKIRDTSGVRKFAQHLASTKGKQDGLYWDPKTADGEESPFGPLVAEYLKGGRKAGDPYYGYYFRVLTRQGNHVPGGRYNYVINGNMIAGFALVAFPAEYGKSGVMTFLVSHHGKVYQKDLGPNTDKIAREMQEFNPDQTWAEVQD